MGHRGNALRQADRGDQRVRHRRDTTAGWRCRVPRRRHLCAPEADARAAAIARSSALYACPLEAREFYEYDRANTDLRYSDRVIHSPGVPACWVFENDPAVVRARSRRP
ncbi:poly(ADP-ribose) glycohydrolase domain-containing protein [Amycolatopsis sp. NPDC049253]|uniref:poly(ADP-ribose) glycohydrolase domain-containing protein n=1 Tax=Amycolatopsis sp. NPDC049253 TaxID=3155274 RepID=UPI00341ECD43